MGVQPPGDDAQSTPETIEFGIAALDARLDGADLEWPATAEELVDALEDAQIPYDAAGNTVGLQEALAEIPEDRFDSEQMLKDRLHPVFENHRANASGLFGQLRALLPF